MEMEKEAAHHDLRGIGGEMDAFCGTILYVTCKQVKKTGPWNPG
jgi:hypothetical protein